jgi:hypothetical protein
MPLIETHIDYPNQVTQPTDRQTRKEHQEQTKEANGVQHAA